MTLDEAVSYALSEDDSSMIASRTPEQTSATLRPPALTRREREVAKLVARGLTNRQIAKELVLSERTVENHVSNILKKLKLSSRSEVAAWVGGTALLRAQGNALHMVAVCQARSDARGRAYYRKKMAEGKSRKETLRCLKRHISDAVLGSLTTDLRKTSCSVA